MSSPETSSPRNEATASRRIRRRVVWASVVIVIGVLIFFGRGILGSWARLTAMHQLNKGAISAAQWWLALSSRLSPADGRTNLVRATCFRHLRQGDRFFEELELARKNGTPIAQIRQQSRLSEIQSGQLNERGERELFELIQDGVSQQDACVAFVFGYLNRHEPQNAERVLDAWALDYPNDVHVNFMRGIYWRSLGEQVQAEAAFGSAIASEPKHELARMALAELYEEQDQVTRSLEEFIQLARLFPNNEAVHFGLARLLRKVGRVDEALAVLTATAPEPTDIAQWELCELEIESGNYQEADRRLEQAHLDQTEGFQSLLDRATELATLGYSTGAESLFLRARTIATTLALQGSAQRAAFFFERVDATYRRLRRIHDLRVRLRMDPNNATDAQELQQLTANLQGSTQSTGTVEPAQPPASVATSGPELYALHCAVCHGANGDGNGPAARHLFPRPRDFRADRFRLVSTLNAVPTPADVDATIKFGVPGTSMPSFKELDSHQRTALAEEVLRLRREGLREHLTRQLDANGEIDSNELNELVRLHATPGDFIRVPKIGSADALAIARGKALYLALGCNHCHEQQSVRFVKTPLFDERGYPTSVRDLAQDPFKGGAAPESIFLRIRLGIPGTAHPACSSLPDDQIVDLVQFCRSVSVEPKRARTNHERRASARR